MRTKWILAALAAFLTLGLGAQNLPAAKLTDAAGKTVNTSSLSDGKTPFVVTFWASWCKPCQKELAALTEIAPDWEGDFPLRIYAVSVDDSRGLARAKAMAASGGWPATVLYDTNQDLMRALNISSIPHVFVYDKNGKQVYSHVGYIPGDEENLLQEVLKAK